jgi:hypothetical protein
MTDVAGGAAAPADSNSAPIEHVEAPPAPLSSDPPAGEAKTEAPKPVPTTREALRAAAAKVEQGETSKAPDPKDAKDAKDTPKAAADLVRDDKTGKFAPKTDAKPGEPAKPADIAAAKAAAEAKLVDGKVVDPKAAAADPAKGDKGADFAAPKHTPPERFSPDAKAAWDTAPEPVKAEVSRMHRELTAGLEKHRAAAERFEHVREFDEMATKSGTDLKTALTKYVNLEQVLRQNPLRGLEEVCSNIGVSLKDVARIVLEQPADQQQSQADATIRDLNQKVARLEQQVGGVTQHFQQQGETQLQQHISKWADSRPHFEIIAPHIAAEMKAGAASLDDAEAAVYAKYPQLAALAKASNRRLPIQLRLQPHPLRHPTSRLKPEKVRSPSQARRPPAQNRQHSRAPRPSRKPSNAPPRAPQSDRFANS